MTEAERIERFEASYNRIDRAIEEIAARKKDGSRRTFAAKVRIAANQVRRLGRHVDFLLEVGDLRNAIVHNRVGDGRYIAVPLEETVLEMERIEKGLLSPERVIPKFKRNVGWLRADDSLEKVWVQTRDSGYTRFPIYDHDSFIGLLTSDGIARWCAGHVRDGRLAVDVRGVRLREVLEIDKRKTNTAFVAADTPVDDVQVLFRDQRRLEAVIITRNGRLNEKPIGLITPGDILSSV